MLDRINANETQMQALSDAELKALSTQFRERLKQAKTLELKNRILEEILPEAFAACREAAKPHQRTCGIMMYR